MERNRNMTIGDGNESPTLSIEANIWASHQKKGLDFLKKVWIFELKMVVSWAIFGRLRPGFHQSS